jgi:GDP-L-fucose synthase
VDLSFLKRGLELIYIAGHKGMVGSAILRTLKKQRRLDLIYRTRDELDLLDQRAVYDFFSSNPIDQVYLAAAKVGGIHANNVYPADFIMDNIMIQTNIISAALKTGVKKLLFLGSSCVYPKHSPQPIKEEYLLSGYLEPTNEPYAVAKIAGIKMCESCNRQHGTDYRAVMPTNLYGPGDTYHRENSHVIPALILKIHEAKINGGKYVEVWGSGEPKREFLYVDEMAAASVHIMDLDKEVYKKNTSFMVSHVNVGTGKDCTIREIAEKIAHVIGFKGELVFDKSKPDGMPRKLLDVSLLDRLGWRSGMTLEEGLEKTYEWFLKNVN